MMAAEYGNLLNQQEFHDFYHKLAERPVLRSIYTDYASTNEGYLELAQFKAFLIEKQMMNVTDANVVDIINQYEPDQKIKVHGLSVMKTCHIAVPSCEVRKKIL